MHLLNVLHDFFGRLRPAHSYRHPSGQRRIDLSGRSARCVACPSRAGHIRFGGAGRSSKSLEAEADKVRGNITALCLDEVIDRPLALIRLKKEGLSECSEPASTLRPQIGSYMALVYTQMDTCYQEDESMYAHPHDPCRRFHDAPLDAPP